MTYQQALAKFSIAKTSKGNYKPEIVHDIIRSIFTIHTTKNRICPSCNGQGETHSPCAFGGSGDYHTCHICDELVEL